MLFVRSEYGRSGTNPWLARVALLALCAGLASCASKRGDVQAPGPGSDAGPGDHDAKVGDGDGDKPGDGDGDGDKPDGHVAMPDASTDGGKPLEPPPFMPPGIDDWRGPAYPLVASDPYFSVWSVSDQLCGSWPQHWTGSNNGMVSMVRVDGAVFRLMAPNPDNVPCATQTSLKVTPTRTVYEFTAGPAQIRLSFFTPRLADDLEVFSRSASYITWEARSTDGGTHDVAVYFDNSAELVVNTSDQQVSWSTVPVDGLIVHSMGTTAQKVLGRAGDGVRIDWGYLHQAIQAGDNVKQVVTSDVTARTAFATNTDLPASDDVPPRNANDAWPVMATTFFMPKVGADFQGKTLVLAYDDEYSIQLMGTNLRPWWRRNGANAVDLIQAAFKDYDSLLTRAQAFDAELVADLDKTGGPNLVRIATLAYRQAIAAHKLVAGPDGSPLFFSKENYSNGCIATVDVTYPSAPLFLLINPELVKGMLRPIADYAASSRWKFPFAPHDLGTYPLANGQVYGGGEANEDNQMPVEESANLILLFAGVAKAEGNTQFAEKYWDLLVKWSAYLEQVGFDPESQLSTDDFAGHLAHNINLSAKAIVALGSYADMLKARGMMDEYTRVRGVTEGFVTKWIAQAYEGDHTKLAFDAANTWSQKYNLVWDKIFGMGLYPDSVGQKELAYMRTKLNTYGIPLDNRQTYTKLDWTIWTATLSGKRDDFDAIVAPVAKFLNDSPDRSPMTDWYQTPDAHRVNFTARSVVGGVFIPMLYDGELWSKWVARAQ